MQSDAPSIVLPLRERSPRRLNVHSMQIYVYVDDTDRLLSLDVKPSYTIEIVIALLHMRGEICWPRKEMWRCQHIVDNLSTLPKIELEELDDDRTVGSYCIRAGERIYYGSGPEFES